MPSQTPDPGRYHTSFNQSSSRSYSMRKKLKVVEPSYNKNPGPGQCNFHLKQINITLLFLLLENILFPTFPTVLPLKWPNQGPSK